MLLWTPTGLEPTSRHPTKGPRAFRRSPAGLGLNAPSAQVEAAGAFLDPDGARTRFPASHERPEGLSQEPCRPRIERASGAGGGSGFDAHYPFQNKSPQPHGWGLLFWSGRRGSHPVPQWGQKNRASRWMPYNAGAGDGARTRYLHLGKVALYQMSYARRTCVL